MDTVLQGPLTVEQQETYDACKRSMERGERLAEQDTDSQVRARVFLDQLEERKSGRFAVDEAFLENIRSELIEMNKEKILHILADSRNLAQQIMSYDPEGRTVPKIKEDLSKDRFIGGVQEKIRGDVKEFVRMAIEQSSSESAEDRAEEDQEPEPPPGLKTDTRKYEAWERGAEDFMRERDRFLSGCHLDDMTFSEKNKIYYDALIANIKEISDTGIETPYPFYYLEAARGFFNFVRLLADSGFDFSRDYEKLSQFDGITKQKGKRIPENPHNFLIALMYDYLDDDDAHALIDKLFANMPFTTEKISLADDMKRRVRFDVSGYQDASGLNVAPARTLFFIRETDSEENRRKALPDRKTLKRQWPHFRFRLRG